MLASPTHSFNLVSLGKLINSCRTFPSINRKMASFSEEYYKVDIYKCAKFDLDKIITTNSHLSSDPDKFMLMVKETEKQSIFSSIRAIWFTVKREYSSLIPVLVEDGYDYHHARPGFVTLCKWIKKDEVNNIPSYSFTNIGVGGLVVNQNSEVLVVKEIYSHNGSRPWKFPGGYAIRGEELSQTAEREVFEETGIKAKFKFLIAMRHQQKCQFDCADMYFVAHLSPDDQHDLAPIHNLPEIADVCWMHHSELLPQLTPFNRFILSQYLKICNNPNTIKCGKMDGRKGPVSVYYVGGFEGPE